VTVQFSAAEPGTTAQLAAAGDGPPTNVVPEPGTLLLMLAAVSIACARIERRRGLAF
jgi:hypothetical protein